MLQGKFYRLQLFKFLIFSNAFRNIKEYTSMGYEVGILVFLVDYGFQLVSEIIANCSLIC